ncbi:xylosyl- and glucuronyltransferase LARGE2 isoform X1 [Dendroctonus ponderosae]|uniref:xylosyl- and glucuronyltransferase LARGE2 isoform X1 n=1 Tax=Dendroctonus ponderosae TaxID=77166 RepID=UPI002035DFC2|nr:xylosyl- and glucuronyltransferase LARGE2 isoform X1 [Dendroctonus ponderosae]
MFALSCAIFLYIQSNSSRDSVKPKLMGHFAKNLYHTSTAKDEQFKPRDFCEIIHIGVVCSGVKSSTYFHALLKSMLLYRSNSLHFHILISNESGTVLNVLFKSWNLPQVNVSFYDMNQWLTDVRWVQNTHYSGNYGLLKLVFNKVVPANVTSKLLVLDTDLIINDDIHGLWRLFKKFNSEQAIGIGENQSPYYLGQLSQSRPWPALGTGFNSGVMLYDFEKMNRLKWDLLWVNLTKRYSLTYGQTDLGDQDILNALIKEHPDIIYKLPCYWNTQMSSFSTSSTCYSKFKPKIIHWNSPQKFAVATNDGALFRGLANSVFEMNGNWFRSYPMICEDDWKTQLNVEPSDCQRFTLPPEVPFRTLLFVMEHKVTSDSSDITYVTHLSFDRISLIDNIARLWPGPISFTMYLSDAQFARVVHLLSDSQLLSSRSNIAYHVVFKQGEFYPTNTLRNTGLKHVQTPFVFLVDVDFVPMRLLYQLLRDNLKNFGDLKQKALVVPAFEAIGPNLTMPENKLKLLEALERKEFRPFQEASWAPGHAATDYTRWQMEYAPYQVKWQTHYEPYIVVRSDVIGFDERFLGFGWNKVEHIMELEAQDYEFTVLSDVFIVHQAHKPSCDNLKYRQSPLYQRCLQTLKRTFIRELSKKYKKNYSDSLRSKRAVSKESSTSVYDSTDFFLVWGGKEKAEGRKEPRRPIAKEQEKPDYNYYFYESEHPYNLTVMKTRPNASLRQQGSDKSSSEELDYEYNEEERKFRDLHESTTTVTDNFTLLMDEDLVALEH